MHLYLNSELEDFVCFNFSRTNTEIESVCNLALRKDAFSSKSFHKMKFLFILEMCVTVRKLVFITS